MTSPALVAGDPLDAFFESYYRLRPVNATFTGVHSHDHRLPDWSVAGVERATSEMRALRERLASDNAATLTRDVIARRDWNAIDRALADSFLEIQIAELSGRHFQRGNPSLVIGEAVFSIISLMIRDFAPLAQRARMARERLRALPRFLATALQVLGEEALPGEWVEKALKECEGARVLLRSGLDEWRTLEGVPADLAAALRREGDSALGAVDTFARELASLPREDSPARSCGRDMLALLVSRGHWCDDSVEQLLETVRRSYAAERQRLETMASAVDAGGLPAVQARLAAAHPSADDYYAAFADTWAACHALSDERELVTWPDAPLRYVPIPAWTRQAASSLYYLYYRSPAPFDVQEMFDYVVTPVEGREGEALARHLRAWNDSVIKLNHVVHHGALGHHVQNWYAHRAPSRIGQVAASDCASRIGMFLGGSMAEGWACYATDLMDEAGFLTEEERVSEQQSRVRMLARALVDLEFHSGVRNFASAVQMYVEEVGMPAAAAHAEVVKNSMFPGTALMYWLGTSRIHALRASRQESLGADFSPRAFHDELLSFGSLPVALVARLMAGTGAR
ncbi:MAG: DUF885 family protein [Gemmatimonadaceae bacterium]